MKTIPFSISGAAIAALVLAALATVGCESSDGNMSNEAGATGDPFPSDRSDPASASPVEAFETPGWE